LTRAERVEKEEEERSNYSYRSLPKNEPEEDAERRK
jgi:hypothetical protein